MKKLTILNTGKTLEVPAGKNLLEALRQTELVPDAPCGGKGTCGKCKVLIDGEEKLACQCRLKDREGRYILTACHGAVYHGRDGEPDYFSGYLLPERDAEKK